MVEERENTIDMTRIQRNMALVEIRDYLEDIQTCYDSLEELFTCIFPSLFIAPQESSFYQSSTSEKCEESDKSRFTGKFTDNDQEDDLQCEGKRAIFQFLNNFLCSVISLYTFINGSIYAFATLRQME